MTTDQVTAAVARLAPSADCAVKDGKIVRWSGPGAQPTEPQLQAASDAIDAEQATATSDRNAAKALLTKLNAGTATSREVQTAVAKLVKSLFA